MQNAESANAPGMSRNLWLLALLVTTAAATFGVYQVYGFYEHTHPEFYWSRTMAAFAAVALGSAGPAMPLILIARRKAFLRMPSAGRPTTLALHTALVLLPFGYVVAMGLLWDLARSSHPLFPTTQTMTLRHTPDEKSPTDSPSLDLDVPGGMSGLGRGHGGGDGVWVAEWEYWWLPDTLREPDVSSDLQVTCTGPVGTDGEWEFTIDVTCDREIVFDVDGFGDSSAARGREPVSFPLTFESGSHRVVMTTRLE